jgi:hypothetical protein
MTDRILAGCGRELSIFDTVKAVLGSCLSYATNIHSPGHPIHRLMCLENRSEIMLLLASSFAQGFEGVLPKKKWFNILSVGLHPA